jgi:hypothetical protein
MLMQFVKYKYSFYEYLYDFCAEAQQTARGAGEKTAVRDECGETAPL